MNRSLFLSQLIASQRNMGLAPQELHANLGTVNEFASEANLIPVIPPDKRSLIAKIRFPKEGPAPRLEFEGLVIVVNPTIPGNAIIVRPLQCMGDPNWVANYVRFAPSAEVAQNTQKAAQEREGLPDWHERVAVTPTDASEGDYDVLRGLQRSGGISPTDVVMKSLDGIDDVRDIIVLRFRNSGDVEMTATLDKMAIIGALQMAMGHVMRGE